MIISKEQIEEIKNLAMQFMLRASKSSNYQAESLASFLGWLQYENEMLENRLKEENK